MSIADSISPLRDSRLIARIMATFNDKEIYSAMVLSDLFSDFSAAQ